MDKPQVKTLKELKKINYKSESIKAELARNLKTLIHALNKFGAFFYPEKKNHLPLKLISSNIPTGIKYVEKKGSAQIISAVVLAALNSFGKTEIIQEKESRNHTQIFLKKIGSKINIKKKGLKNIIQIMGKKKLNSIYN